MTGPSPTEHASRTRPEISEKGSPGPGRPRLDAPSRQAPKTTQFGRSPTRDLALAPELTAEIEFRLQNTSSDPENSRKIPKNCWKIPINPRKIMGTPEKSGHLLRRPTEDSRRYPKAAPARNIKGTARTARENHHSSPLSSLDSPAAHPDTPSQSYPAHKIYWRNCSTQEVQECQ